MVEVILIITGCFAALLTYLVSHKLKLGVVKSSAGLSLVVALYFLIFPNTTTHDLALQIQLVFFGASFAGMVSQSILPRLWQVCSAGIIFSLIYINTSYFFEGFGGALGTTACIAVVIIFGFKNFLKKQKSKS